MNTRLYDLGFRERLRSQRLIRALVGLACFRVTLALQAGTGYHGILLAATTFQWILCTASLILLVLLNWAQRQRHPGIGSLSRELSYVALAGSLLPATTSLRFPGGSGAATALAGALVGLALTLFSASELEWLLVAIPQERPLPSERVVVQRMFALVDVLGQSYAGSPHLQPQCSAHYDVLGTGIAANATALPFGAPCSRFDCRNCSFVGDACFCANITEG
jgi:hypothetical protein